MLLGLFFIAVGMLLDLTVVVGNIGWSCSLLVVPVLLKLVLIAGLARLFGAPPGDAMRDRHLPRAGGRVRVRAADPRDAHGVLPHDLLQPMLAAMLLSMCAAPFLIQTAEPIVLRLTANDWLAPPLQMTQIAAHSMARRTT